MAAKCICSVQIVRRKINYAGQTISHNSKLNIYYCQHCNSPYVRVHYYIFLNMEILRKIQASKSYFSHNFLKRSNTTIMKNLMSTSPYLGIKASELTKENIPPNTGCPVCSRGITFKMTDVLFLSQFMTPEGHMINRRKSGVCKKQQRKIFKFIHIARRIGLLPRIVPKDGGPPPIYGQKSKSLYQRTYKSKF
ncbi:uncharacterized protein LOC130656684 [Hydractinia symbiolongicarpus]|uniref:uncharacterized protein LOC130656684 n=1 Tax=Hydractinia symbiolongicarpus TaxID=13093 RepID=UPI00254E1D43|nr:uncharacterized protein LOC130656684 [Hydractinia symbiolongicarpus]